MKNVALIEIVLLFCAAIATAQQGSRRALQPPEDGQMFSSDLVAWTFMQQPQMPEHKPGQVPAPDPSPETQPPQNSATQSRSQAEPATDQTFIGTVAKDSDNFVLRVSTNAAYKLDNQPQVQQYEGRRVRVTGTLERSMNLIHVDRIEPIS